MRSLQKGLIILFLIICAKFLYAGAFSPGIYGNIEAWYEDQSSKTITTNADWNITGVRSYFEFKMSGKNLQGFDVWSQLGANVDFTSSPLTKDYISKYFGTSGINSDLKAGSDANFQIKQWQAHIQKSFQIGKGGGTFALYRGEDRSDVGQRYLDYFGDIGDGETKIGMQWDIYGIAKAKKFSGINTKGFIIDYRSDEKDETASDRYTYAFGGRIGADLLKKPFLNINLNITGGASQYDKTYTISDISSSSNIDMINKFYYNVLGIDMTLNGDIPIIGNYYLFFGLGRSYAPESYVFENRALISLLGNTNALVFVNEFKWNKKLDFGKNDFGYIFLGWYMDWKQPHYQEYLGGGDGGKKFYQEINFKYNFPVKQVSMNAKFGYSHDYDFVSSNYNIWQTGVVSESSAKLTRHLDLNVMFKSGFAFNIAWDQEIGQTYLGAYDANGVNYLTFAARGESSLGSISPQFKIVALGDTNKQLISSGIDIFVNLSSWLKFYSRFAYVQSAGYWKSGTDINWWTAFAQLRFEASSNSRFSLELGNGGHTDSGFVSDSDLINGASFEKRVYFRFEYW